MTDTEKILEFDRIKEKLAELACTEKARLQIQELKPSLSELVQIPVERYANSNIIGMCILI